MHPIRQKCTNSLIESQTHLHEILSWAWPHYGDKYGRVIKDPAMWVTVARVYFVPELTILLSGDFNLGSADSARTDLLRVKMYEFGPERVIAALRKVAALIDTPNAFIPYSIDFNGRTYIILESDEHGK